jgi:hypothetical protein
MMKPKDYLHSLFGIYETVGLFGSHPHHPHPCQTLPNVWPAFVLGKVWLKFEFMTSGVTVERFRQLPQWQGLANCGNLVD